MQTSAPHKSIRIDDEVSSVNWEVPRRRDDFFKRYGGEYDRLTRCKRCGGKMFGENRSIYI